jgi:thioredoxin reductase (NADPH)
MYDVVIIGGGPAGLTAAIYASRRGLKTLVISKDVGGQITRTNEIENYPGFDRITGAELGINLLNQAKKFGTEFIFDEVKLIEKKEGEFLVQTIKDSIQTRAVILAFGKKPRELDVPGEEELKGRGVSYCATCDAPFFRNKTVVVVGGGNSALDAALISGKVANKVYLIHRGEQFRGEDLLVEKVTKEKNIELITSNEIREIVGKEKVEEVILKDDRHISTDGIIIEIGFIIDRSLVQNLVKLDKTNQVEIDEHQNTSIPGIFAAGDLTTTPYKQIVIAAAEGAKAALSAFDYIQKISGKKGILADWH